MLVTNLARKIYEST